MDEEEDWFEEVWRYRDEKLYPRFLAGDSDGKIVRIPYVAFSQLGADQVDPRWLHCGVLRFGPTQERHGFAFITSGLSSPWDDDRPDPNAKSGLGIELRLDNPVDAHWPKDVLLRLSALQLLIGAGRVPVGHLLKHGDQIVVGAHTFGDSANMTGLIASATEDLQLASGTFQILQLFAITEAEQQFGTEHGGDALLSLLKENSVYPMNDLTRPSIV